MDSTRRSVVVNGDLGSGKSTVSALLAQRLGIRRVSVGDLYREMAAQRGLTALQLNIHAELDDKIDFYVDQLQREIAASGEQLVVDSRLAWHFFTGAVKVHLITEPMVAARRVLGRPADTVESYTSADEALARLASRSQSERVRFISRYGVDKSRLRHYDLVCDSTSAAPPEIAERIVEAIQFSRSVTPRPLCFLDPGRIHPTEGPPSREVPRDVEVPVTVGYTGTQFFAVDGHDHLRAAIRAGDTLIPARLAAQDPETIDGQSCGDYLRAHATRPESALDGKPTG